MSSGCGGFLVVSMVSLSKALCNITDFIAGNVASIVAFPFANKLTLERTLSMGQGQLRDKDEDLEVFKAL